MLSQNDISLKSKRDANRMSKKIILSIFEEAKVVGTKRNSPIEIPYPPPSKPLCATLITPVFNISLGQCAVVCVQAQWNTFQTSGEKPIQSA